MTSTLLRTLAQPRARLALASAVTGAAVAALSDKGAPSCAPSSPAVKDPFALEAPKSKDGLFFTTLLRQRVVFLSGSVTEDSAKILIARWPRFLPPSLRAKTLVAQLLFLEMDQPGKPITMYITSGGGLVYAGLAVYDVMQHITSPVHTVLVGHAESMAAVLLAAGEPGKRTAMPHGRVMLHQPSLAVSRNTSTDVMIQALEGQETKQRLVEILARHTKQSEAMISASIDRNHYMNVSEAVAYGLVDAAQPPMVKPPASNKTEAAVAAAASAASMPNQESNNTQIYKR